MVCNKEIEGTDSKESRVRVRVLIMFGKKVAHPVSRMG